MEAFILYFLKHLAPLERPRYTYYAESLTPEGLVACGSPHAPAPSLQQTQTLQYIDFHLSMLEVTRYYWRYFGEYFNILAEFCLLGSKERLYLIKRGMIFWLLDWYMGDF